MPANIRTERPARRSSSQGMASRAMTPKDITPDDASWADRQERDIHSEDCETREDALLDEAIELSFPASDPIAELPHAAATTFVRDSQEAMLDAAIELTFPASDPIAISMQYCRVAVETGDDDDLSGQSPAVLVQR